MLLTAFLPALLLSSGALATNDPLDTFMVGFNKLAADQCNNDPTVVPVIRQMLQTATPFCNQQLNYGIQLVQGGMPLPIAAQRVVAGMRPFFANQGNGMLYKRSPASPPKGLIFCSF